MDDGWMDGWWMSIGMTGWREDGCMDGPASEWEDGWVGWWLDGTMEGWAGGWMGGWREDGWMMHACMDAGMDWYLDGRMDGG